MRFWGIEPTYDSGRMIEIYGAIKDLPISTILDCCCGEGLILDGLSWVFPATYTQFDIETYPEWQHLRAKPFVADVMEFIQEDQPFDLVLFLNSYRNMQTGFDRRAFDTWLKRNARYFITSNPSENGPSDNWAVIGKDVKGHDLKLYEISH